MANKNKSIEDVRKSDIFYTLKVENIYVNMEYSNNNKSFKECMLNILKQKVNEGR